MFTPLDILYLVLAFCALWISVALFWLIYQIASILRDVHETLDAAHNTFTRVEKIMSSIRDRVDSAALAAVPVVVAGVKKAVEFAMDRQQKKKKMEDADQGE